MLLIVAALATRRAHARRLRDAAADFGLDALVEVHDERELEVALAAGATLSASTTATSRTFAIDMSLTERIARRVPAARRARRRERHRDAADVRRLGDAGAHAMLVGEPLMRAPSPGAALRELLA